MNLRFFVFILLFVVLTGCKSKLDKLLMSNDSELKEQKAKEYFENCNYVNASPLFKDLIQSYSTSAKVEKMYYYFAFCDYKLEDYLLGAYEFKKITEKFPRGNYAEKAQYYLAMCYYHSVPKYSLDQDYNVKAIEEFQVFLEKFPNSELRKDANEKIEDLIAKQEQKLYETALLYYGKEDFKSALYSLQEVLNEFPDTKKQEEIRYLLVSSAYSYADKSIEAKKSERYKEVNKLAAEYLKHYENKKEVQYLSKVKSLNEQANQRIKELIYSLPMYYFKRKKYDDALALWNGLIVKEKDSKTKNDIANNILMTCYNKANESSTGNKIENIRIFLDKYRLLFAQVEESKRSFWTLKYKYLYDLSISLPFKIPYDLTEEGEYKSAIFAFNTLLDTTKLNDVAKSKHFYAYLNVKVKLAAKSDEETALGEYQSIVDESAAKDYWKNSALASKIDKIVQKANIELAKYPLKMITEPMKRKDYRLAIKRGKDIIDGKKMVKNQEEVVYLMIVSSLKNTVKGKRYDKLPKYQYAEIIYNQYQPLITDSSNLKKLEKMKQQIDTKLNKYQIK